MPFKITKNSDGLWVLVEGWHPVNGKWVHIVQEVEGKEVVYYTDGKKEFTKKLEEVV